MKMHRRMIQHTLAPAVAALVIATPYVYGDETRDPAVVKERYETVVSRLDTGGDLLVVLNVEGMFKEFMDGIVQLTSALPPDEQNAQLVGATVTKLESFLDKNGFYAVRGLGFSSVPRADGTHTIKAFLSRDPASAQLPLWRGLVGFAPRKLAGTDFVPANAVLMRVANGDLPMLWKLVRSGFEDVAPPQAVTAFNNRIAKASRVLGIEVDQLVNSLGDESFLSIQLSAEKMVNIPSGNGMLEIPEPSILLGCKVKSDMLMKMLETQLATNRIPVMATQVGESPLRSVMIPLGLPFPVQPTFATHAGFFLLGSNAEVVKSAITAFDTKNGLISTADFKKAFAGLPTTNNGMEYASPRLTEVIMKIQSEVIGQGAARKPGEAAFLKALMKALSQEGEQVSAFITRNVKSGVLKSGTSSSGGREVVASLTMAPIGMMAAIAIPSFVRARTAAGRNACINNLRQIDAAKEQWALEFNKDIGTEVDREAIKEYIRRPDRMKCPKGGTYTINPVGQDPTCSVRRHSLNFNPPRRR